MIVIGHPHELTLEALEAVAFGGESLALGPGLLEAIESRRAEMLAALESVTRVYGVNTGMGYLSDTVLDPSDTLTHQRNLLLGRAVGSPPWLNRGEARAVMVARLCNFISGHAGVGASLCSYLVDRLNDDFVPAIPLRGTGSAGEVVPLAHAWQTFLGVGSVLEGAAGTRPAAEALDDRAVAPFELGPKEGIALLAGAPGAIGLATARRRAADKLARQLLVAGACSIVALEAPQGPYQPAVAALGNDPVLGAVLEDIQALLPIDKEIAPTLQAPVSYRVIPQVGTHLRRTIMRLEEDLRRALGAVTDSPAFIEARFVSNGGFHAIDLAAGMDALGASLIRSAELAGQHIHRLLDHRFSGLPDQLTARPGPRAGLIVVHKRVTGSINELRRLAGPVSVGLADTSLGQEDAMTFEFEAADNLRRIESLVTEVVACELLAARQAWALRGARLPEGLRRAATKVEAAVLPVEEDRPLGGDIDSLIRLLERDDFL